MYVLFLLYLFNDAELGYRLKGIPDAAYVTREVIYVGSLPVMKFVNRARYVITIVSSRRLGSVGPSGLSRVIWYLLGMQLRVVR